VLGLTAGLEELDDEHTTTAAGTGTGQCAGLIASCCLRALGLLHARPNRQQLSYLSDIVCAGGIGEEAVMPDAVQTFGQDLCADQDYGQNR